MAQPSIANVPLTVQGLKLDRALLPHALQPAMRAVGQETADRFLPPGLLTVTSAHDLTPVARSTAAGSKESKVDTAAAQVVVLELADATTIITSPEKLAQTLSRLDPKAVLDDGSVRLDALRDRAVASRGVVGDAAAEQVGRLVSRVFTLTVGEDPITDAAKRKALEWLGEKVDEKVAEYAELGVTWIGTRALMWAIESRLDGQPGLYRWRDGQLADQFGPGDARLEAEARQGPALVFIHGTASNTAGSFSDLQRASADYWQQIEDKFQERVYAFEHRTLSESPIENALALARVLPAGATVSLVTHSRGGLVGDLLCLDQLGQQLIDAYALDDIALAQAQPQERDQLRKELQQQYADQRNKLQELAAVLQQKQLRIERYVRVACPARGTRLASGNFDVFLSGLLTLVGLVPALAGNILYSAFKRVVLEIAKNRTKPNVVPGIEAMLPESPMARLLARATPQAGTQLAVIAGDIEGGGLLKRLGVLFTDYAFFDGLDNDLVVDTDSMYAGIARPSQASALFEQGPAISHFRYFSNDTSRNALRAWLTAPNLAAVDAFKPLPGLPEELSAEEERATDQRRLRARGAELAANLPVVIVLPGIMGSHLWVNNKDRVWFDFDDLLAGGLEKIQWPGPNVGAEKLFGMFYGDLCEHLQATHRVVRFPYDWRQPLDVLAQALQGTLRGLLEETKESKPPIRLLAHSMGGLVVRALIHADPALWTAVMERNGARLVMLGTPNQGSHLMVETLVGKTSTIRTLGRMDLKHNLQGVLDIVAGFRGALQLLPRPGFEDTGGAQEKDYFDPGVWSRIKRDMRDFWFGNGVVAEPGADALAQSRWLWDRDNSSSTGKPALPAQHQDKVAYVFGCAASTPCGIRQEKPGSGSWKMLGTPYGDGSVSWASGRIDGIGGFYYMPVEHGSLADTTEYFDSLTELLERGTPGRLMTSAPVVRDVQAAQPLLYDAGPPVYGTPAELARGLIGGRPRLRGKPRPQPTLAVSVKAMDLRFVTNPILVGHYEQDAISGAEALIDRELVDSELSVRKNLGLYAGPIGTATVVLFARNEQEQARGSFRGAVVAGLGEYDGTLSASTLTDAVRTAALRYLLHVDDTALAGGASGPGGDAGLRLTSLLLGYNSSASLSISDSVTALVRGVVEANRRFADAARESSFRISKLEIVELYLDAAISATYALQRVAKTMNDDPRLGCRIDARPELEHGDGCRHRLDDARVFAYWPRLVITDADRREDECPPECFETRYTPGGYDQSHTGEAPSSPTPPAWVRRRTALADRLRFLYLGQRARAETVVQQRQPGLVETLVAQQIRVHSYQEDFSRTLFQLLVPHEFKDAARQLDRVVFVVDGYTANLPWELMLADDKPLAVRTPMLRQLSSTRFRARVRQTLRRCAYVIGNPSSEGYAKAFPNPAATEQQDPDPLPAAEQEANNVVAVLKRHFDEVEQAIGADQRALDVINRLYSHPYRILHIAAHGIYDERAADGKARSGVVLSDGLLITAAEIGAMETVPDLVFLNCCHLGKVDRGPIAYNKLAYSVARELIEIGVRVVVVAGWAVNDDAASFFAETFYTKLLQDNQPFGDAVFLARQATWDRYPTSLTWGAYQAYGDPGWVIDPRRDPYREPRDAVRPVAPEELIAQLEQVRLGVSKRAQAPSSAEQRRTFRSVKDMLKAAPEAWQKRPDVSAALAQLYADLGPEYFAQAREAYEYAIRAEDRSGGVPIRAIEQLANLESRDGEMRGDTKLIERAIERLKQLDMVTRQEPGSADDRKERVNVERQALIGSAYKRKATVHARQLTARSAAPGQDRELMAALQASERAYRAPIGDVNARDLNPYPALNWLFLLALTGSEQQRKDGIALARRCAAKANEQFSASASIWDAAMAADAYLVECLLDGSLGTDDTARVLDNVWQRYRSALVGVMVTPKERNSIVQQICLMGLFYRARAASDGATAQRVADRLRTLAEHLEPGGCGPDGGSDAPSAPAPDTPDSGLAPSAAQKAVAPARAKVATAKPKRKKPAVPGKRKPAA
jgi:CHAT domain-containing protein/triacylglycerol esterase/lipase EstA (alpha/beta hydrolase family)